MSRSSSITCDVCGKRGGERVSDWFEIDAGQEGVYIAYQAERPAGIARASKDICGARCLNVALERWANKHMAMTRGAPVAPSLEVPADEPERIGPRMAQSPVPLVREPHHRPQPITAPTALPVNGLLTADKSRLLEVFRKAVSR